MKLDDKVVEAGDGRDYWSKWKEDQGHMSQMEDIADGLMWLIPIVIIILAVLILI